MWCCSAAASMKNGTKLWWTTMQRHMMRRIRGENLWRFTSSFFSSINSTSCHVCREGLSSTRDAKSTFLECSNSLDWVYKKMHFSEFSVAGESLRWFFFPSRPKIRDTEKSFFSLSNICKNKIKKNVCKTRILNKYAEKIMCQRRFVFLG